MPGPCRRPPSYLPAARREAQRLQGEADAALTQAEALKLQARLEDLTVWEMKKVKESRKGCKTYTYWMASWREGDNAAIIKNTETSTLLDSINFSRDQPQIPTGNQKKSTLTYNKDGKLHFNIFQKDYFTSYILLRNKALRTFRDCVVETEATQEGGPDDNGYGIILRYVDDSNFYRFRISGKGNYGFDKMQNHEWFDIVPWTNSAAINTGNEANRIKVECNGDNFTFYVNDVKLGDCTDKSFATGGIGLVAETHSMGGVHVSFNGIKVWALLPEDSTESAQKLKVEPQLSRAQARLNEAQNKLNQLNLRK